MTFDDPSTSPEWLALVDHAAAMKSMRRLRQLFADAHDRADHGGMT